MPISCEEPRWFLQRVGTAMQRGALVRMIVDAAGGDEDIPDTCSLQDE